MQLYGYPALESLSTDLFPMATSLVLHYMEFGQVVTHLPRVRETCPALMVNN